MHTSHRKIIIASNNNHKIEEIKNILKDFPYEILSMSEIGINKDVEENGKTFEENALKKATEIAAFSNEITLADDSGLEVYALDNAPGVYSARFSGEHGNDKKNNMKLLELMQDIPIDKRGARFVCSMVLITPLGEKITAQGYVEGIIGYEEKGNNGFGYDPLFIIPEYGKTFAELDANQKNAISHRGRALIDLKQKLSQHLL